MSQQYTLAIIKPTPIKNKQVGPIIDRIEKKGFVIKQLQLTQLSLTQAQTFYKEHAHRPFYNDLCNYMISGPVIPMILEKENAVEDFRSLIGPTDPKDAKPGTIRRDFGVSIDDNSIHGSDGQTTAEKEIAFFFPQKGL